MLQVSQKSKFAQGKALGNFLANFKKKWHKTAPGTARRVARSPRAEWHDRATPSRGVLLSYFFVIFGFGLDIEIPPWFEAIEVHQFGIRALISLLG